MNTQSGLRSIIALLAAAASIIVPPQALGEPTDLDPTFGVGGIARLQGDIWLVDAAAFSDGRLALLVGGIDGASQPVITLDTFGRIDASFQPVKPLQDGGGVHSLAVTRSGQLITLQVLARSPDSETWLTRHLDDGTLDPVFGSSGGVFIGRFRHSGSARIAPFGEFSSSLAVDPSGRVYTSTVSNIANETWITRIGEPGSPVEQLNRTTPSLIGWSGYGSLRADSERTVVAALPTYTRPSLYGPLLGGPALIRLVDGVPDTMFGLAGIAFHPLPSWIDYSSHGKYDFASLPDGGYMVVGVAQDPQGQDQIVAVKFTGTGVVDAAFGESGVAFLKLAGPGDSVSNVKLAIQQDGRIVVASSIQDVNQGSFFLIRLGRLTAAGKPDPQFAAAGVASFWVEGGVSAKFLAVRPDGRIVVVGEILARRGSPTGQPAVFQFLGGDSTRLRPLGEHRAIEYFHAGFGHYFLTADVHEIANLDVFNPNGWARTGYSFRVWDDDDPLLQPTCRFWSDQSFAPKSSHFYTPYEAECATLKSGDTWRFERNAFSLKMPVGVPGSRTCPTDSQPLYRAYNNGHGGAPNHRYTTEPSVLDQVLANGWTMEGEAATRVFACVPLD